MNIFVSILAFIGFIFILAFLYYLFRRYEDHAQEVYNKKRTNFPPKSYMLTSAVCPNYWVNDGYTADGQVICVNKYNLPFNSQESGCYDDNDKQSKNFNPITRFPPNPNSSSIRNKCKWMRRCGARVGNRRIPVSWIGIDQFC